MDDEAIVDGIVGVRGVGWGDDTDEVRQQSCVKSLPQSPSALCSQY